MTSDIKDIPVSELRAFVRDNISLRLKTLNIDLSDPDLQALVQRHLATDISSRRRFQAKFGGTNPNQVLSAEGQNSSPPEPTASSPTIQSDESTHSQPNRAERALQHRDREQGTKPASTGRAARALDLVYGPKGEKSVDSRDRRAAKAFEAAGFKVRLNKQPAGSDEGRS